MQFVKDLKNHKTKCQRVKGLQKLLKANLQTPKVLKVTTKKAFAKYIQKGMTKRLRQEIEAAFFMCKKIDPTRSVYIGRAFYIPGIDNPAGLRFSVNSKQEATKAVKKHFDFAIKQKYNCEGSEISVIFHPWINPKIPQGGGCTVLSQNGQKQIIIEALYGIDEGIQSFPHDIYIVDFKAGKICQKIIAHKTGCLQVNDKVTVKKTKIPKIYADNQVLSENLILQIAKDFKKFLKKFKPHRLEYAFQKEGIYYRECVPFVIKTDKQIVKKLNIQDKVLAIKSKKDFKPNPKAQIIFIDPITIQKRKMNLLTQVACNTKGKKIILFPGTASTAHITTIFREAGHTVILVGNQIFKTGQKVKLLNTKGELKVFQ